MPPKTKAHQAHWVLLQRKSFLLHKCVICKKVRIRKQLVEEGVFYYREGAKIITHLQFSCYLIQ